MLNEEDVYGDLNRSRRERFPRLRLQHCGPHWQVIIRESPIMEKYGGLFVLWPNARQRVWDLLKKGEAS